MRRVDRRTLLGGLGKLLAVVVAGTAAGALIGIILSALSGGGGDDSTAAAPATTSPTPSAEARTSPPAGTPPAAGQGPDVRILSATLISATTASGRARRRARIVVRARMVNPTGVRLPAQDPILINGADQARVDPRAKGVAGALMKPVPPRATAEGELRFETAGALTTRLTNQRRGRLRVGATTVPVRIKP